MKLEETDTNCSITLEDESSKKSLETPSRNLRRPRVSTTTPTASKNDVRTPTPKRKKRDKSRSGRKTRTRKSARTPRPSSNDEVQKRVTKPNLTNNGRNESYSYSDLFVDEDQEMDENVDAGDEDSEYAPSDEEVTRRSSRTPRLRKGVSTGTRRSSKTVPDIPEGGSTDEDEAGESESEDEDEEEDELGETALVPDSVSNGDGIQLFSDENNQVQRDIYDFDAQSIISDKRITTLKKRVSAAGVSRSTNVTSGRSSRRCAAKPTGWGSNIYSALAVALKTRVDLDAYSSFLKSDIRNLSFDNTVADICKPSTQHANLFYGASESLQSLMSRINDHDKVVELLHAFVSRPYGELKTRIVYLAPIIHQPLFGMNHISPITQSLESLVKVVDSDMIVKPAYLLNETTNLLGIRTSQVTNYGVSPTHYNCVTGAGNLGRYMPDIRPLVVSSDLYQRLGELIALPLERVYELAIARAHQEEDEANINISPLEPPNLQRIVLVINSDEKLLGVALLDTWSHTDVPHDRHRLPVELLEDSKHYDNSPSTFNGVKDVIEQSREEQVTVVLNDVIDWVVLKSDPNEYNKAHKRGSRQESNILGQIHFMDAFLVKPNGRRDTLLLAAHRSSCHPPLDCVGEENDTFHLYSIVDESKFTLEKHGFTPDMPISIDGVHSIDPEEILEDKSLLVVSDLLFDTLMKVMLRELVSSTGTAAAAAVVPTSRPDTSNLPLNSTGAAAMMQCTKFVIVDRQKKVPLAIAFDCPARLTLQVSDEQLGVHPYGEKASACFDQVTASELKVYESTFKPTTAEYRLVAINGLIFGLQIDDKHIIRRVVELVPARFDDIFPHSDNPSLCAQSATADQQSCPANVRIINDETNSSTVLPAFYYPHYELNKLSSVVSGFTDHLCSLLFELPILISLYDIVFRMAQKYMPELLTKQHIEAAEAAAYAEAAANPHAPPPAPVPLPEHWGVCCFCAKELRSPNGLLDHEMRHLGLTRFRCGIHNVCFIDRRSWNTHMVEFHGSRNSTLPSVARPVVLPQQDSGSEQDDDDGGEHEDVAGSGLVAGLANVFNTNLLAGRMEAPQCEKCGDYFLSAETMAQHLDLCDSVSFSVRTPISRAVVGGPKLIQVDDTDNDMADSTSAEGRDDTCVCGICGTQVLSREKLLHHFTSHHLQCILCNEILRSMEELSCHYRIHIKNDAKQSLAEYAANDDAASETTTKGDNNEKISNKNGTSKTLLNKLLTCDICTNFYGTKYNYYFHQWNEHGVVHPPVGTQDGVTQVSQPRHPKTVDEDDPYARVNVRRMKCKLCGLVVRVNGKDYIQHLQEKHEILTNNDVVCRICADIFESPAHLSAHLSEIHVPTGEFANAGVQTIFRCTHCDFWGFTKGLLKHAQEVHGDLTPAIYECVHCYERFSDKRLWRSHLDKHNEKYAHRCLECGRAFRLRPSLHHHMRNHHSDDHGPATCDYCGLTYPKRSSLRYHIFRMHNQELAHECFMCQRRFRLETELRRHVKETHGGAVKCEICHKVCTNLRCYSQHRQKHFRTRIYQCTDCQTTFKSKLAMKRHIRVEHLQLGPEKFECQICGKIVTQIGMHMLIHKEARFECEYCGKRFTKAAYYNEHLRIHRGEQPFECHICQKRFNKKSNLNVHLKFHEKHRDDEGNYLELKPRGRISTMFGDALMSPSDRAARQAAAKAGNSIYVPKVDVAVGSDFPGAFNCTGPAGAAAEAASRVAELYGVDTGIDTNHTHPSDFLFESSGMEELVKIDPFLKKPRLV